MNGAALEIVTCLLILLLNDAATLKNLKIIVPEKVRVGDSAILTCSYDLENAQLYAIKWYFEDQEFYRFIPKKDPPHYTFPVQNIQVNVSGSNMHDLTIINLSKNHTGSYKCEVSEDQPRYDTKLQEADILVIDVPTEEPKIVVDKLRLASGDILRANCTSGASRPAPNITWTLNGKPLNSNTMKFKVHTHTIQTNKNDEKQRTKSKLRLNTNGMFQGGRLRLRCFAEITPIYKASVSIQIIQDGPYVASPHSHQANGSSQQAIHYFWLPHGSILTLNLALTLLMRKVSTR